MSRAARWAANPFTLARQQRQSRTNRVWYGRVTTETIVLLALAGLIVISGPLILTRWRLAWVLYLLCVASNGVAVAFGPATFRIDLLAIPLLGAVVLASRSGEIRRMRYRHVVYVGLAVWLLVGVVSSAFHSPEPIASYGVLSWMFLGVLTLLLATQIRIPVPDLLRVGAIPLGALSALSVLAWGAAAVGLAPGLVLADSGGAARVVGLSFEPNIFGGLAVLWVALVVYWRSAVPRSTFIWTGIVAIAGVLTLTRAVWVALALVLLPVILGSARRVVRVVISSLVAVIAVPVLFGDLLVSAVGPIADRFARLGDLDSGTAAFRIGSWETAWADVSRLNLLTGLGVNSFTQRHRLAVELKQTDYLSNAWLAQIHDVGILGAICLVVALFFIWLSTARRRSAFGFFLAFVITSAFTSALWFAFPWLFMGLFDFRLKAVQTPFPVGQRSTLRERESY